MKNSILVKLGLESETVAVATVAATAILPAAAIVPSETTTIVATDTPPTATVYSATGLGLEPPIVALESETIPVATVVVADDGKGLVGAPDAAVVPILPAAELPVDVTPPVVVDTVAVDTVALALDTDLEYVDSTTEVVNATTGIETLLNVVAALESIVAMEPATINVAADKAVVQLAIDSAASPLQTPEFSETISVENINEKVSQLWEAIKAALKALFAKIASFFKFNKSNLERNKAKVDNATSTLKSDKVSAYSVRVQAGEAHRVFLDDKTIVIESNDGLEVLSAAAVRTVGDTLHDLLSTYAKGFTSALSALAAAEVQVKHFDKTTSAISSLSGIEAELSNNPILAEERIASTSKVESETLSESQLLVVFGHLNINLDNADKLVELMDKQHAALEQALEKVVKAAKSNHSEKTFSWVQAFLLRKVNAIISKTTAEYSRINKAINVQSSMSSAVVTHIGHLSTKK